MLLLGFSSPSLFSGRQYVRYWLRDEHTSLTAIGYSWWALHIPEVSVAP